MTRLKFAASFGDISRCPLLSGFLFLGFALGFALDFDLGFDLDSPARSMSLGSTFWGDIEGSGAGDSLGPNPGSHNWSLLLLVGLRFGSFGNLGGMIESLTFLLAGENASQSRGAPH